MFTIIAESSIRHQYDVPAAVDAMLPIIPIGWGPAGAPTADGGAATGAGGGAAARGAGAGAGAGLDGAAGAICLR